MPRPVLAHGGTVEADRKTTDFVVERDVDESLRANVDLAGLAVGGAFGVEPQLDACGIGRRKPVAQIHRREQDQQKENHFPPRREAWAAASARTTSRPDCAPLRGGSPVSIQSRKCWHSAPSGSTMSTRGMCTSPWRSVRYSPKPANEGGLSKPLS